jgi:putative transcriptional regulator
MHTFKLPINTEIPPEIGRVLIAEPFLNDPSFVRSVIYLCEHDRSGSLGFILNKPMAETVGELLPELEGLNIPVFNGGPVDENVLYVLHQYPKLLGGNKINGKVYLGADYDALKKCLLTAKIDINKIKFFMGYSGWASNQLAEELMTDSWLVAPASDDLLFNIDSKNVYNKSFEQLDKKFSLIPKMPINPIDN